MSLKGKIAIVTGGNSGIGMAIVLELAKHGANIVIDYVAHPEATEALEKQVAVLGDQAIGVDADVSKVAELQKLINAAVEKFGRVEVMVNNAGVETRTSVLNTTEQQYEKVLAINLKSAFFGTQLAAQQMIKQGGGGRIINIASQLGLRGEGAMTLYAAAKAALIGLTRSLAREGAPHGVLVNAIAPGPILTERFLAAPEDKRAAISERLPLQRCGTPEELGAKPGGLGAAGLNGGADLDAGSAAGDSVAGGFSRGAVGVGSNSVPRSIEGVSGGVNEGPDGSASVFGRLRLSISPKVRGLDDRSVVGVLPASSS